MTAVLHSPSEAPIASQRTLAGGIVGLGLAGGIMVPNMQSHPGLRLAAAAEPCDATRSRFEGETHVPAFSSIEDMLREATLDFVYIATPHQYHRAHAVVAANNGKHVIVEKPMALSLKDCDEMIAAAAANHVQLLVGHTHSFDPAVMRIRELIVSGAVGRPVSVSMWNYTDFLYRPRRAEELDTAAGGGIMFNQIPHQIDIARMIVGAPVRSVRGATSRLDSARPTEGGCSAFIDFENGATATIAYSGYDRFDSDELHDWVSEGGYVKAAAHGGSRRALRSCSSATEEEERRRATFGYGAGISVGPPPHQPHFGLMIVSCERADLRQSSGGIWIYDDEGARHVGIEARMWRPGRGDVLEEMRRAIIDAVPPIHDGAFGRGTVEASMALLRSAVERREVVLNERRVG
jgi:phthalate 4,5-cis-dihydrodiol dehydrogenase